MAASFRFTPIAAALVCLSGLSAPALAQTAQQNPATATLPEVRVQDSAERADGPVTGYRAERSGTFTKTDTPLKEVPASVTVVPSELMKDQAMRSMGDVIRYVPGALQHQGEGNRDEFILRGISSNTNLFVDGVRDDAQVFRDLYNLERVEVLKGAGGMIFGRGTAGGAINRVTKKPVFGDVGEASLTLGSYGQTRGALDVGRKLNDSAAWRLNAVADGSDSFRNGAEMTRYAINPTVMLVPGVQTTITIGFEALRDERTADRGFPAQAGTPVNAPPRTFFGNASQSNARSTVNGVYAILDHDFGSVQLKNTFRVTHYDKFYQNVYADNANTSSVTPAGRFNLAAYNNQNQRTNTFNQTDLTTRINAGGFEHTLLAGLELGRQDSDSRRNTGFFGPLATNNLIAVSTSAPFATAVRFQPNGTDANNNVKADIAGVYVEDQIALSKEWKALAGLRYDHFKVDFDDRRTTTPPIDFSSTNNAFSPRAGLIWSPNSASSYYTSYSYSFLPSSENLAPTAVNASLDPEKAKNYEIGARWDLRPGLTLSSALFRLDRDNVKNSDGAGGFVLTGQQRTQGVEIGLQGDVMRNWQVYAGYAHLDSRITKASTFAGNLGNRPQLVPENTLSVWNRLNIGDGWGAGLGIIGQGSSFANADNVVKLPGFTRADGAVYFAFAGGKTRLALNVENLLNKQYFPTADGNNNISPGAPRTARLTLSTKF